MLGGLVLALLASSVMAGSVVVNGQRGTDSEEWPDDNPTIDLTVVINADGSVAVQDT